MLGYGPAAWEPWDPAGAARGPPLSAPMLCGVLGDRQSWAEASVVTELRGGEESRMWTRSCYVAVSGLEFAV